MSIKPLAEGLNNNIQGLPKDIKTSIFAFLSITCLKELEQASSTTWANVANYKIDEINEIEIKEFINGLQAKLDPVNHKEQREILEQIKTHVKLEIITPLKGFPVLKPNVFIIRKLIIDALSSLDKPAVESLKSNSAPRFFEDVFKILELLGEINSRANQIPTLPNAVKNGDLDIVIEVVKLIHPENQERKVAFRLIAESLIIDRELDRAVELINLIYPKIKERNEVYFLMAESLLTGGELARSIEVTGLILGTDSNHSLRLEIDFSLSD